LENNDNYILRSVGNTLKHRIPEIKTLAMLKMEKNFIALDKGYPRQPYLKIKIEDYFKYLETEIIELKIAIQNHDNINIKEELADISNFVDYIFEMVVQSEFKKNN
jgi:NTP pyrophosphatase (non-canonical NTP hydrolase)